MLILNRKIGESILIGDNVKLTVCHLSGDTVRIGVAAPQWLRVDRLEVRRRIEAAGHDPRRDGRAG